jgi:two-component system OmpR family sensor kinase
MIRFNSLRTKINLIFLIAYVFLILIFGFLYKGNTERSLEAIRMQERANMHYLYLYFLKYGDIDKEYLKSQNICVADEKVDRFKFAKVLDMNGSKKRFQVVDVDLKRYILINNDGFNIVLENMNRPKTPYELIMAFMAATLLMFVLYLWMIRSIKPLSTLKKEIIKFSDGNLDISCKSNQNDEIAEVANAFDYAAEKIRELLHSRQLLLRAIMHELKTPIAKGRLVSEMVNDEKQKRRFHAIFERLNLLIDEFAKVEQIASKNFNADLKQYKISDIIDASIDMLMLDDPSTHVNSVFSQDYIMQADFELLSLAIKNLLDNGIKYSRDKEVQVVLKDEKIRISNHGEALKEPLEEYFKPFHASKGGLGLGLYIVKSILDIHKLKLQYHHEEGKNVFTIYQSIVTKSMILTT